MADVQPEADESVSLPVLFIPFSQCAVEGVVLVVARVKVNLRSHASDMIS